MKRVCLDCGDDFYALNTGFAIARFCDSCVKARRRAEEAAEKAGMDKAARIRYNQLVAAAGIPPKWLETTFDNSNPKLKPVPFKVARQYAEEFTPRSGSLIFYSPGNGTGKTHLAACIANYVLHQLRYSVMYEKARDLMLEIRRTFSDHSDVTEADILEEVGKVDLLVLDDVGLDPPSEWLFATYWTVLDRRLEWLLPVVITTNKPIEAEHGQVSLGDQIGERSVSRLVEMCQGNVIDMTGPDLR